MRANTNRALLAEPRQIEPTGCARWEGGDRGELPVLGPLEAAGDPRWVFHATCLRPTSVVVRRSGARVISLTWSGPSTGRSRSPTCYLQGRNGFGLEGSRRG